MVNERNLAAVVGENALADLGCQARVAPSEHVVAGVIGYPPANLLRALGRQRSGHRGRIDQRGVLAGCVPRLVRTAKADPKAERTGAVIALEPLDGARTDVAVHVLLYRQGAGPNGSGTAAVVAPLEVFLVGGE